MTGGSMGHDRKGCTHRAKDGDGHAVLVVPSRSVFAHRPPTPKRSGLRGGSRASACCGPESHGRASSTRKYSLYSVLMGLILAWNIFQNHFGANIVVTRGPLSCRDGSYPPYYAANITSRYFFYCKNPQCRLQAKHKGITSQIEIENLSMLKTKNVKVKDIDVCGTLGACFLCSQT
ncbi:hypothetical protein ZEAMMB73_Zm00001d040523 [Zea mays]|uniref:Uncharacterized protein n=1 Tax=Zea mays TaxID=4577 RepID=A0A1D6MR69_MAIZE|nr:hypothetical protein ZEAMMB73_Zm00001d040523 [Zea mays]